MSAVTSDEAVLPPSPEPRTPSLMNTEIDTLPSSQPSPDLERPQTPVQSAPLHPAARLEGEANDDLDPALKSPTTLNHLRTSLITSQTQLSSLQTRLAALDDDLADTQSKLHDKENENRFLVAAKEAVEKDLNEERNKRVAAEENVELLRGKLEDARKALTGAARNGGIGIGMGLPEGGSMSPALGGGFEDDGFGGAGSSGSARKSKRASTLFGPSGVGSTQRKISESTSMGEMPLPSPGIPTSTSKGGLRELRLGVGSSSVTGMDSSPRSPAGDSVDTGRLSIQSQSDSRRPPASPRRVSSYERNNNSNNGTPDLSDPVENLSDSPPPPQIAPPSIPIRSAARRPRPTVAERLSSLHSPSESGSIEAASPSPNTRNQFITLDDDDNVIDTLRTEVAALKAQLNDAQEARVASEDCLKALREFIALSNSDGTQNIDEGAVKGIKLPPLPTDRDTEEAEETLTPGPAVPPKNVRRDSKKSGWSLAGYWSGSAAVGETPTTAATGKRESISHANSVATSVRSEAGDLPVADTSSEHKLPLEPSPVLLSPQLNPSESAKAPSTPLSSFVQSWTKGISIGSTPGNAPPESAGATATPPAMPSRKFSFFGKRESVASVKKEAEEAVPVTVPEEEKEQEKEALMDEGEKNIDLTSVKSRDSFGRRQSNASIGQVGAAVSPVKSSKALPTSGSAELPVEEEADEKEKKEEELKPVAL